MEARRRQACPFSSRLSLMNQSPLETPSTASPTTGRLLAVAAAVLWSTGGFFAKAPDFVAWSGASLAFWRAIFACVILLPLVRRPRLHWRMAPMVICFAAMNYTFLNAMKLTEASNAIWLQNTSPIWVVLVNFFILKLTVTGRDWFTVACGAVGVAIILTFELRTADPQGVMFGIAAALTYAGVVLSLKGLREEDSAWLIALNHIVTAVVLAPFAVTEQAWPEGRQWLLLAFFGMLQMGAPYVLFARSLRVIPSHEAAAITLLEPVLTPIWVFLAWHTHPTYTPPQWWTLVGGGLILVGLGSRYLSTLGRHPQTTRVNEPDDPKLHE